MNETLKSGEQHRIAIYCDGACEPNPGRMTIGVYCADPLIAISRDVGPGTNNVAECLAAIVALEEAARLGVTCFVLHSDSRLLCNWTSGQYQCRSATAQQCIPQIRQLLLDLQAELRWIPGRTNPADGLSRQLLLSPPSQPQNL